ncbi:MAG: hypothetical protein Q8943_15760, partial [Bacteroidota bacterium]|nr:hypothetical protein [Bacteroidota bacterium]
MKDTRRASAMRPFFVGNSATLSTVNAAQIEDLNIADKIIASFSIAVLFACRTAKPADNACIQYKEGKFVHYLYNNSGVGHWHKAVIYIDRADSVETEMTNSPIVDTFRYRLNWTSPCAFQLTFISASVTSVNTMVNQMGN